VSSAKEEPDIVTKWAWLTVLPAQFTKSLEDATCISINLAYTYIIKSL